MKRRTPTRKEVFDAITCDSAADGCDGDWRAWVLENAQKEDVTTVRQTLARHTVLSEALIDLEMQAERRECQ